MTAPSPERELIAQQLAEDITDPDVAWAGAGAEEVTGYVRGLRVALSIVLGRPGDTQLIDAFFAGDPAWRALL